MAVRFHPNSQDDLAPSGEVSRIRANLEAIRMLRTVLAEQRPATPDEQAVLARWSGWGAVPAALDEHNDKYTWVRDELATMLDEQQLAAARRTVLNAHYTDARLAQAIWSGLRRLGLSGGRVLEPGCGSGNFIGLSPDGVDMVGVELDPTTAAIASHLYPDAQVVAESFADTRAREGSFDAAVGNVPFGALRLHDKRHNPGRHAIHNHFIIKSLRLTRPGGLVAVITSAYTMDSANPAARREMQQLADLVGAVRLPSRAHARAAGTDALTDVLIFRRREDDRLPRPFTWEYTQPVKVGEATLRINAHLAARPEMILGELATGDGLYRADELRVAGDPQQAPAELSVALTQIAVEAQLAGLVMSQADPAQVSTRPAALLPARGVQPVWYLSSSLDGSFTRQGEDGVEPFAPPKTQAAELRALLRIRDAALDLLEAEAATVEDTDEIDQLRGKLGRAYDAYTHKYGPINRFTLRPVTRLDPTTGARVPAVDEHTGAAKNRRVLPPQGGFRRDPYAPLVRALEVFDDQSQTATKATIFSQRVVSPHPPRLGADTPAEALTITIDEYGEARLDRVAWLLGVEQDEARRALDGLVFDDPQTGRLEPAAAYLSGHVRGKLAAAQLAAKSDPRLQANVTALAEVLPRDLGPDEIAVQMGAPWIAERYVQQFLAEILNDGTVRVEHGLGSMWSVRSFQGGTVEASSVWGTGRVSASEIAQNVLEQRTIRVFDTVRLDGGTKKQVPNLEETVAANEKATEMRERFAEWVWEDPQRTAELLRTYNDTFNSYVLRSYQGTELSLPGLSPTFKAKARPHQVAAVARIINEPGVGLYHTVGAGKTAVMVMAAMELRRLGLASKPVIVVPNNLLDQFAREFQQLYPRAKLLAAGKDDLAADKRRQLVARIATGDWDAVIMTESSFLRVPMSPQVQRDYIRRQVADLKRQVDHARRNGHEKNLKRAEDMLARREEKLEAKLDGVKDDGVWFELTGIDYIFRDESDRDKNLHSASHMEGMSIDGSQRASEMDMKLSYLRDRHARWGTRATGTPVANSMIELYTEFKYLRPDLLDQLGITDLDSYLSTFAQPVTRIEVTPDGGGLRTKSRVAKFVNVPELLTHLHVLADVKTPDDLDLPRPQLAPRPADGLREPETVIVPPSEQLLVKVAELVDRAEKIRGKRPEAGEDNMLNITHEGRSAALDLRLVGMHTDQPQKIHIAAGRIAAIWAETADRVYEDDTGQPHPTPGALQLVFCDLGTPGRDKPWSVYDELAGQLVSRGMPRDRIRFVHEAKDDKGKWELFQAARDGRINVLIGSTERMGAGTNAQNRAIALHHLDPQWRPRDIEQREGRIWRQGNQNPEVRIIRYVTERSFDAYMWQTLERKKKFIDQIMRGSYDGREAEDLGDGSMSYEEVKAAATGNPVMVDHAAAKADLTRLERLQRAHRRNLDRLRWTIRNANQQIEIGQTLIGEIDQALARRVDTRGKAFTITIGQTQYTKRAQANNRLRTIVGMDLANPAALNRAAREIGSIGGFTFTLQTGRADRDRYANLALVDCPRSEVYLTEKDIGENADIVTRLEDRLAKLETLREHTESDITRRHHEIERAEQELVKPFRHADALTQARQRFQLLDTEIAALAAEENRRQADSDQAETANQPQREPAPRSRPAAGAASAPALVGQRTDDPPAAATIGNPTTHRQTDAAAAPRPAPQPRTSQGNPADAVTGEQSSATAGPATQRGESRASVTAATAAEDAQPAAGTSPAGAAAPGPAGQPPSGAAAATTRPLSRLVMRINQRYGTAFTEQEFAAAHEPVVADAAIQQAAAVNDADGFRVVFGRRFEDAMVTAVSGRFDEVRGLAQRYFNDANFRGVVHEEASNLAWQMIRAHGTGTRSPATDEPVPGEPERPTPAATTSTAASIGDPSPEHPGPAAAQADQRRVRLAARLRARADQTGHDPNPLASPHELRRLASEQRLLVSDDERYFANLGGGWLSKSWEVREATTGVRLIPPGRGIKTEQQARAAFAALSHSGVDLATAIRARFAGRHRDPAAVALFEAHKAAGVLSTEELRDGEAEVAAKRTQAPAQPVAITAKPGTRSTGQAPAPSAQTGAQAGAAGTRHEPAVQPPRSADQPAVGTGQVDRPEPGTTTTPGTGDQAHHRRLAQIVELVNKVHATRIDVEELAEPFTQLIADPRLHQAASADNGTFTAAFGKVYSTTLSGIVSELAKRYYDPEGTIRSRFRSEIGYAAWQLIRSPEGADPTSVPTAANGVAPPSKEPVRLELDGPSVLAKGTSKDDMVARNALKDAGFKWSGRLQAWWLPRNLLEHTRRRKIGQFQARMRQAGREIPVIDHANDRVNSSPYPTAATAATTARLSFPAAPAGTVPPTQPSPEQKSPAALARTASSTSNRPPVPSDPRHPTTLHDILPLAVAATRHQRSNGR